MIWCVILQKSYKFSNQCCPNQALKGCHLTELSVKYFVLADAFLQSSLISVQLYVCVDIAYDAAVDRDCYEAL